MGIILTKVKPGKGFNFSNWISMIQYWNTRHNKWCFLKFHHRTELKLTRIVWVPKSQYRWN